MGYYIRYGGSGSGGDGIWRSLFAVLSPPKTHPLVGWGSDNPRCFGKVFTCVRMLVPILLRESPPLGRCLSVIGCDTHVRIQDERYGKLRHHMYSGTACSTATVPYYTCIVGGYGECVYSY